MRGIHAIFNSLINEKPQKRKVLPGSGYGRNPELIRKRDELLNYRYFFYVKIQRLQYQDCLQKLSCEFFLSTIRISEIITEGRQLEKIAEQSPTARQLETLYPHLNWKN